VLVNTSRGEILDEAAVAEALRDGRLAGAALDVLSAERAAPGSSPLRDCLADPAIDLLVTPHIGGATWESMARTEVFMARRLVAFIQQHSGAGRAVKIS
jgi:phosphoglycerate dehydrogenase-like enzyme